MTGAYWRGAKLTVSVMAPLVTAPLEAVIRAIPGATPVTTPSVTVATLLFEETQEKVTPAMTAPLSSLASAVKATL